MRCWQSAWRSRLCGNAEPLRRSAPEAPAHKARNDRSGCADGGYDAGGPGAIARSCEARSRQEIGVTDAADVLLAFDVSRESEQKLRAYVDLLRSWQQKMNLVSAASLADVWTRHIADSLQLLRLIPQRPQIIADLGSGAGFPGLMLAIAGPHRVQLYESIGKKARFLREAIRLDRSRCRSSPDADRGCDRRRPKSISLPRGRWRRSTICWNWRFHSSRKALPDSS